MHKQENQTGRLKKKEGMKKYKYIEKKICISIKLLDYVNSQAVFVLYLAKSRCFRDEAHFN